MFRWQWLLLVVAPLPYVLFCSTVFFEREMAFERDVMAIIHQGMVGYAVGLVAISYVYKMFRSDAFGRWLCRIAYLMPVAMIALYLLAVINAGRW